VELSNAEPRDPAQKQVNISAEQRARKICCKRTLYRQTALQEGDAGLATVLDELSACCWMSLTVRKSHAGAARNDPEKIEGEGSCSKSGWSTRNCNNARRHEACAGAERFYEEREEQSMTIGNSVGRRASPGSQSLRCCWRRQSRARVYSRHFPCDLRIHCRRPRTKSRRSGARARSKREGRRKRDGNRKRASRPGKVERLQELYDDGREDLDEDRYDRRGKIQAIGRHERSANRCRAVLEGLCRDRLGKRDTH